MLPTAELNAGKSTDAATDQADEQCRAATKSATVASPIAGRCGRGGRPSYWSPAGRENRSSPAGTADASSGGRYWARNDCSTDGCCSASEAAEVVVAHSFRLSSGRSLTAQQRVPS